LGDELLLFFVLVLVVVVGIGGCWSGLLGEQLGLRPSWSIGWIRRSIGVASAWPSIEP
jgi:hypothetical protein